MYTYSVPTYNRFAVLDTEVAKVVAPPPQPYPPASENRNVTVHVPKSMRVDIFSEIVMYKDLPTFALKRRIAPVTISDDRLYFMLEDIEELAYRLWKSDTKLKKPMWFGRDLARIQAIVEGLEKVSLTLRQREEIDIRVKRIARTLESTSIKKFLAKFPNRRENYELTIRSLENRIYVLGVPMTDAESAAIQEAFRQLGANDLSQLHGSMALSYASDCLDLLLDIMQWQWGENFLMIRNNRGMLETIDWAGEPEHTLIREEDVGIALVRDIKLCVQALGTAKILCPTRKDQLMGYLSAEMSDLRTMVHRYSEEELKAMREMGEELETDHEIELDGVLQLYQQYRSRIYEASLSYLCLSST